MEKQELTVGDLVQFSPEHPLYPGQLVMVTSPRTWGGQGVLFLDREYENLTRFNGRAFVRFRFEEVEEVGSVEWVYQERVEDLEK